jgi:hypothetical protein
VTDQREIDKLREQLRIAEAVRDDARAASARDLEARRAATHEARDGLQAFQVTRALVDDDRMKLATDLADANAAIVSLQRAIKDEYTKRVALEKELAALRVSFVDKKPVRTGNTLDIDGRVDSKGVRYMGAAYEMTDGTWRCLADVGGALCIVEVTITSASGEISGRPTAMVTPQVKTKYPASCKRCNDRGTIETGNNDHPCDCPAGDMALFNTERGTETGAEIKRRR